MRFARFLLAALFFAGCSSDLSHEAPFDEKSPLEKQAKARLDGSVQLQGETDHSQITVELQNDKRTYSVDTQADGAIKLTGIVPGTYQLSIRTRYFEPVSETVRITLGESFSIGAKTLALRSSTVFGSAVAVDATETMSGGVSVKLTKTASIRTQSSQAPASFAAHAAEAGAQSYSATSSPNGEYQIANVPAGQYDVMATGEEGEETKVATATVTGEGDFEIEDIVLLPLTGFFKIAGMANGVESELYTSTPTVTLFLTASGTTQKMKIVTSTTGEAAGCNFAAVTPETYAGERTYFLGVSQGVKLVCVKFIDVEGKETLPIYRSIVYDATPPVLPSLQVNNGKTVVKSEIVTINLSAVDVTSGVDAYQVNTSDTFPATQRAYQPNDLFTLPSGDGMKSIYVKFGDRAGNFGATAMVHVTLDTTAPLIIGAVTLEKLDGTVLSTGNVVRDNRIVLRSNVSDSTALEMQVSTTGAYGMGWEPYNADKIIDLTTATSNLIAQVRDSAGYITPLVAATVILLDNTPPVLTFTRTSAALTSDQVIGVTLSANESSEYQLSESPGFAGAAWSSSGTQTFPLSAGDGLRTVYARAKDAAGNISEIQSVTVTLDQTPPQGVNFTVNSGDFSNSRTVALTFAANDAASVRTVEGVFCSGTYGVFGTSGSVNLLSAGDGLKNISVQFRDAALNEVCLTKTVTLDETPPEIGYFQINSDAQYASQQLVMLALAATGATEMLVSESPVFVGAAWEAYAEQKAFLLSAGEGVKTVHVMFRDQVGNTSGIVTDTIDYDPSAPQSPFINIVTPNDGYAMQVTVSLVINASNADWMMLSESPLFTAASWEAYSAAINFVLANTQGNHTLYAKFKDNAGNESGTVSDTVVLDTIAPVIQRIEPENNVYDWRTKTINLLMIVTGADRMKMGSTSDLSAVESQPYSSIAAYELIDADGLHDIHMEFQDLAGNVSDPYLMQVNLDRLPPAAPVVAIEGGADYARNRLVQVHIDRDGTEIEYLIAEGITFGGAVWQPIDGIGTTLDIGFTLQSVNEGTKSVYFKTRDRAGNESLRVFDTIELDTVAPVLNFFGKAGASKDYANSAAAVPFQIDSSAADYVRLSTDGTFDTEDWQAVTGNQMTVTENVSSTEGVKRVYVQLKDGAGNESIPTETSFILDTTAPQAGTLTAAQGSHTNTRDILVMLSATGADFFQFDTTTTTLAAQPKILIQPARLFTLPDADGLHTYWMRYGDKAENYSDPVSVSITLDRTGPTSGAYSLLINDGDAYTTQSVVTLSLVVTGATEMQIRNQPFFDNSWEPVTTSTVWFLPQGDGLKGVFVRFRDEAGNISGPAFDAINLDQRAPEVSRIVLDNNAAYTNSLTVSLRSEAREATEMRYGADASLATGSGWIDFVETLNVVGTAGDETKTVYAQFRDAAGNTSAIFSDSIILDQTPPSASSLSINGGETYTREPSGQVFLSLSAVDELSGVAQMQLSNTSSFAAAVTESFITPKGWTLNAIGEGAKEVWARFRDRAGNYSTPVSDLIVLDRVAPAGLTVSINGSNAYATSNIVSLTLDATDANGVSELKLSTLSSLGDGFWQPFTDSTGFILPAADMTHRIYAKVRDEAGNESSVEYDEIQLDTVAPEFNNLNAPVLTSSSIIPLQVFGQGATEMRFSTDSTFAGAAWIPFANSTTYTVSPGDGSKTLYGQLRDAAGLKSVVRSVTVELDTAAPQTPMVRIREGDYINDADVEIETSAENSTHMLVSQYSAMTDATWQPFNQVIPFTFTGGDGVHSIYVRVRDGAGNVSNMGGDMTTLDTVEPAFGAPSFRINAGDAATSSSFVSLGFNVIAATELQVSEDSGFGGASWVPYSTERPYTLSNGDGPKTVYARFRDQAGNQTATINDSILLDTKAPSSPFISAATSVTKETVVVLNLSAVDADEMKVSQLPDFSDVLWIPYATVKSFTLAGADGSKVIYAKFRRSNSGIETPSVSVNVLLDRVGPADAIAELASLVTEVTTTDITLRLSAADVVSGLDSVEISESPIFFDRDLISMRSIATYTLRFPTQDFHPIYVRYLDRAGNYSSTVTLGVVYDITPPTGTIEVAEGDERINSQFVTVALTTDDAVRIKIYNDSGSPTEFTYSDSVIWAIRAIQDTPTTVNVIFIDTAGNQSTNYSDIVTYDTQPPVVNSFALGMTVSTSQLTLAWSASPLAFGSAITGYTWYRHLNGVSVVGATVAAGVTSVTVLSPLAGEEYSVASWYADGLQSALSTPAVERGYTERTKGILLVDDDAGGSSVEDNLAALLTDAGYTFDTSTVAAGADGPDSAVLGEYQVVIWSSGEATTAPVLSAVDRTAIQAYLESGGNFLYLGPNAVADPDTATFLKRWVHTGRVETNISSVEHLYVPAGDIGGAAGANFAVGPQMDGVDALFTSALSDAFLNAGKPVGLRYPLPGNSAAFRAAWMAIPTAGLYQRTVTKFNLEDTTIPDPSEPGIQQLTLGDDDAVYVQLPFSIRFGGLVTDGVWIGSNSVVGFKDPITTPPYPWYPTSDTAQYPGAFVPANWIDLQPNLGGQVYYSSSATQFVVVWKGVPVTAPTLTYPLFMTNAVRIYPDNRIDIVQLDSTVDGQFDSRFDARYVDFDAVDENGVSMILGTQTRSSVQECCHNDDIAISIYYYNGLITESATFTDRLVRWLAAPPAVRKITPRFFSVNSTVTDGLEMRVSIDGSLDTEPYQSIDSALPITGFTSVDGTKSVQVVFRDEAGNITAIYTGSEVLDTDAPKVSNVALTDPNTGSNAYTRNRTVTLTLESDASSRDFMRISESAIFIDAGWTPFVENSTFTLSEGDGPKQVYVWVKDENGNISSVAIGAIEADTVSPSTFAVGADTTSRAPIYVSTSYAETLGGDTYAGLPAGTASGGKDREFIIRELPFAFSFFGQSVSKIVIFNQGLVTFQLPDPSDGSVPFPGDDRVTRESIFAYYRLAAPMYLKELVYTKTGHDVYLYSDANQYIVTWVGEDPRTQSAVNVAMRITAAGDISFLYGDGNYGLDPLVGIGNGAGNVFYSSHNESSVLTNVSTVTFTPNVHADAKVKLYYRYHYPSGPGAWVDSGLEAASVFDAMAFYPPNGAGEYDFYTVGIDTAGNTEAAPGSADLSVLFDDVAPLPPTSLTAEAEDDAVFVQWKPSLSSDVVAYRIYYGDDASLDGNDASEGISPFDIAAAGHIRLSNLEPGKTLYVAVSALDQVGNESPVPSGVAFTLPRALRRAQIMGTTPATRVLTEANYYYQLQAVNPMPKIEILPLRNPYSAPEAFGTVDSPGGLFIYNQYLYTGQFRYVLRDLSAMSVFFITQSPFASGTFMAGILPGYLVWSEYGYGTTLETIDADSAAPQQTFFAMGDGGQGMAAEISSAVVFAGCCDGPSKAYGYTFNGTGVVTELGQIGQVDYSPEGLSLASGLLAVASSDYNQATGALNGVQVFDFSNPSSLVYQSAVSGIGAKFAKWVGDRLVTGNGNRLLFYDYADVTQPVLESMYGLSGNPKDYAANGSVGMVVGDAGSEILELGELLPTPALWTQGTFDGNQLSAVATSGDYTFIADGLTLSVYRLSSVTQAYSAADQYTYGDPELVGSYQPFQADTIVVNGNYLYAGYQQTLKVVDISDPANPLVIWSYTESNSWVKSLAILGTTLFTTEHAWDIRDPRNPEKAYELWSEDLEIVRAEGDLLYGADRNDAIKIYRPTRSGLQTVGYFGPITSVRDIVPENGAVYIYQEPNWPCCGPTPNWQQLTVLDAGAPASLTVAAEFPLPYPIGQIWNSDRLMAAQRGFLYMTEKDNMSNTTALVQIDLRNIRQPQLALRYEAGTGESFYSPIAISSKKYVIVGANNAFTVFRMTPNVPVEESFLPNSTGARHVVIGDRYVYYAAGNKLMQAERRAPGLVFNLIGSGEVAFTKKGTTLQLFDPPGVPAAALTADGTGIFDLSTPAYDTTEELCTALAATGRLGCSLKVPGTMPSEHLIDAFGVRIKTGKYPSLRAQKLRDSLILPPNSTINDMAFGRNRLFLAVSEEPNSAASVEGLYIIDPLSSPLTWVKDDMGPKPSLVAGPPTGPKHVYSVAVRDDYAIMSLKSNDGVFTLANYNWADKDGFSILSATEPARHLSLGHNMIYYTGANSAGDYHVRAGEVGFGATGFLGATMTGSMPIEPLQYPTPSTVTGLAVLKDRWVAVLTDTNTYFVEFIDGNGVYERGQLDIGGQALYEVNGRLFILDGNEIHIIDALVLPPTNKIERKVLVQGANVAAIDILGDMMAIAGDAAGGVIYRLK